MALQEIDQEVSMQEEQVETPIPQLSRQNSILSLTLDEFQCKSGKSFGSLNMEEFLASICNSSDEATASHNNTKSVATEEEHNISQHDNSFSVPPPICKKTVDEVWSEIHKNQPQFKEENSLKKNESRKKQQTLGEMTLEDFFVKAGVVQQQSSSLSFQNHSGSVSSNTRPLNVASYGLRPSIGMGYSSNGLVPYQMMSQNNNSGVPDRAIGKSQNLPESSGCSNNSKMIIDGPSEVVVERRQRRMLKNRESAARSRARRQAYTVELEAELNHLKEENEKLKQILAEAESKRRQELLQRTNSPKVRKGTEKLRGIRRPISATW
ncbi:ABSCISIC ACID-INSENSITIVE 5-like protein 1 isoform X2 [Vicia villosa]|nr:ABSCISIC ACID-INSENSITIVE 5-like protein 1 isoform X2 [Vicia villosa]